MAFAAQGAETAGKGRGRVTVEDVARQLAQHPALEHADSDGNQREKEATSSTCAGSVTSSTRRR